MVIGFPLPATEHHLAALARRCARVLIYLFPHAIEAWIEDHTRGADLKISEHDNSLDFDLAMSVAEYFRVKPEKAKSILREIKLVTGQWNKIAADAGLSKAEQERMSGGEI